MFIRRSSLIVGCVLVCSLAASAAEVSSGDKVARLLSQKKYQQAEQLLLETIKKTPKSSAPYERLGRLYADEQRFGDAIAIMEKRMPLPPRSTAAAVELAMLYEEHGDHEKSLDVIKAIPVASRPARLCRLCRELFRLSRAAKPCDSGRDPGSRRRIGLVPQLAKSLLKMGSVGDARGPAWRKNTEGDAMF
jgi:tetratricopeptide (TPR) repeat protein